MLSQVTMHSIHWPTFLLNSSLIGNETETDIIRSFFSMIGKITIETIAQTIVIIFYFGNK